MQSFMFVKRYLSYHSEHSDKFWQIETRGNATCVVTQGNSRTMGRSTVRTFDSKGECLRYVDRVLHLRTLKGYLEGPVPFAYSSKLPVAVQRGLLRRHTISTKSDDFNFYPWYDAPLISIILDPTRWSASTRGNPFRKERGVFCAVGYGLAWDAADQDTSRLILVWMPSVNLFGVWDRPAQSMHVFPGVSWGALQKDFARYFGEDERFPNIFDCLKVWDHFDFIPHDFPGEVADTLVLPERQRRKRVQALLERYAPIFERNPLCPELTRAFQSIISLYYQAGQWLEEGNDYTAAAECFERSLSIVNQSHLFRSSLFIDIFLQLGFCYAETARFDMAMQYIDMYQRYNPSAWDSCSQIKASIYRVQQLYKDTVNSYLLSVDRASNGRTESGKIIARALRVKPKDPVLHFNLSCFYSVTHQSDKALHHFEEALRNGYRSRDKILWEKDLNPIRSMKRFEAIRFRYF